MLEWVNRNGKILLAVRPIQSFAASFVSISFAIYLKTLGLSISQIGLVLTGGLISSTLISLIVVPSAFIVIERIKRFVRVILKPNTADLKEVKVS